MHMDDLGSDAEEDIASCEETSSEETEDVQVCFICGDVGEEKKLAVCSRCNDGAVHTYCMKVMLQKVPESGWLCEECQAVVEIEIEKKNLEKNQGNVVMISMENKVDAENVAYKESNEDNQGNGINIKRKEEDAGIIDKPESRLCNVCCAPCSSLAHLNCPLFPIESEVGNVTSGCTPSVKEDDSGLCIVNKALHDCEPMSTDISNILNLKSLDGGIYSLERCNNVVSSISKAKDVSNVAAWNKRLNRQSDTKSYEQIEDVKVCDICGDIGEEEKLAVCSRCNDGAEHVYCMRVMMEKVPEVMWLCEACQTEVEVAKERMKPEKSQVMICASKLEPFEGRTNKPVNDANSGSSSEDQMEADNAGSKNSNMRHQPNVMATKKAEDARISSLIGKNLSEPEGISIEDDSRERVTLCKNSLKLDANKGKELARQLPTSLALNALTNKAPPLHGPLLKSISFNNSKVPKVKQLVIEVPPKTRNSEEPLSSLTKQEESMSALAESTPFKKPNSNEPANKGKSSLLLHAEEPRMMTSRMSRNVTNKRGTSISGYPSVAAPLLVPVPSKLESAAQHLNKRNKVDSLGIAYAQGSRNFPGTQRKGIQIPDTSLVDKIKNPTSLKPGAFSSSHTMHCQRCDEVGHSTLFCPVDRFNFFVTKPLSEQTSDRTARSNRISEATTLAATEEDILRSAYQSEAILERPYHNPLYKPTDVLCTSVSHARSDEQNVRNGMPTPSSTASVDCPELNYKEHQATSAMGRRYPDSSSTMLIDPTDKLPIFSTSDDRIASSFPELAYIWQGCFELWRTGRSPDLFEDLQVHLSCSASPKVLEIAKKFPSKILLEELPRQNLWPPHFHENGPRIGLFFFARDIRSYESHYSKLVENMLKNDLALRGNIGTAELLIFPSNILSKNFQRWNMFYYLWGVFRVRRKDSNLPPHVPTNKCSNFNVDLLAMDQRTHAHASSGPSFSKEQYDSVESGPSFFKSATCEDAPSLIPLEANHERAPNG